MNVRRNFFSASFLTVALFALAGCPDTNLRLPDIVIEDPGSTSGGFKLCYLAPKGGLLVHVGNVGTAPVPDNIKVKVTFEGGDVQFGSTKGVPDVGQSTFAEVPLGESCGVFSRCKFDISVDPNNDYAELDETNNMASGECADF
jgi:hypothetical protein